MNISEKTPQQIMEDFKNGRMYFHKEEPIPTDFHTMALLASQTLPNQSVDDMLQNAEKIEWWLREPQRKQREQMEAFREAFRESIKVKSPAD